MATKAASLLNFPDDQQRFLEAHRDFLAVLPQLQATLKHMIDEALERFNNAPEDADETVRRAEMIVLWLVRAAYDDFLALVILTQQGMGFSAMIMVRSMYERLVTGAFFSERPEEATKFVEHSVVHEWKLWQRMLKGRPSLAESYTKEKLSEFEKKYQAANEKRKVEQCSKCGQPITKEAWTRIALDQMAEIVNPDLSFGKWYSSCYLVPTAHAHANPMGLEARIIVDDQGALYRDISEPEAHQAAIRGHGLAVSAMKLLDQSFDLEMAADVMNQEKRFMEVWLPASEIAGVFSEADPASPNVTK